MNTIQVITQFQEKIETFLSLYSKTQGKTLMGYKCTDNTLEISYCDFDGIGRSIYTITLDLLGFITEEVDYLVTKMQQDDHAKELAAKKKYEEDLKQMRINDIVRTARALGIEDDVRTALKKIYNKTVNIDS